MPQALKADHFLHLWNPMCGIAGIYRFGAGSDPSDLEKVQRATGFLGHRGPDNQAAEQHGCVSVGHARLSIIDTSPAAHQPMQDGTERYVIVYNGELYNYKTIRKELEAKGRVFRNQSDTEVILNAYAQYGKECLHHFNGFFAFAIYDKQTQTLFAARDRMGIKPFYYSHQTEIFAFGSELKAVAELANCRELNKKALHLYFQLTYVPAPLSMFEGVNKLLPGHFIEISDGKVNIEKYHDLSISSPVVENFKSAAQSIRQSLFRAVEMRLVSDVPLGTFLSGGIDSSIVTFIASQYLPNLDTFSLGFSDAPYLDESAAAKEVARAYGTRHHEIMVAQSDLGQHVFSMLETLDEPFADSSAMAVYILSKHTREHVKVALSGDGADELFGGYRKHRALLRSEQQTLLNTILRLSSSILPKKAGSRTGKTGDLLRKISKYAGGLREPLPQRYWNWLEWTSADEVSSLLLNSIRDLEFEESVKAGISSNDLNSLLLSDLRLLLPNDMLTKVDRMSMAHGLEVRTPFLDHRLVEQVLALPFAQKCNIKQGKLLLREAFKDDLPESVFHRPKKGFEIPVELWLRGQLKSELLRCSERQLIEEQRVFNYEMLRTQIDQFLYSNQNNLAPMLWSFVVFQNWWLQQNKFL